MIDPEISDTGNRIRNKKSIPRLMLKLQKIKEKEKILKLGKTMKQQRKIILKLRNNTNQKRGATFERKKKTG